MKLNKLLILGLATLLSVTTVSNVNAYSTANKKNKSSISVENIDIKNLFSSTKLNKIPAKGCFNGSASITNDVLTMTWTGKDNSSDNTMYYSQYLYPWHNYGYSLDQERILNKQCVENIGIEVEKGKTYKISFDVENDKYCWFSLYLFFANSDYEGFLPINKGYSKTGLTGSHIEHVFKMQDDANYISFRIDPYWSNPTSGNTVKISNIKVQKVLN